MEHEGSLPHSQQPATCSCREPKSSPRPSLVFLTVCFNIIRLCLGLPSCVFYVCPRKSVDAFLISSYVPNAPPISFSSIWSCWLYLVRCARDDADYVVLSLLSRLFAWSSHCVTGAVAFFNSLAMWWYINPLKTKRNLLYIKTLCVPCCKHFQPQL
jgi:hypothetical protein